MGRPALSALRNASASLDGLSIALSWRSVVVAVVVSGER